VAELLHGLFCRFDAAVVEQALFKIDTVGAFMNIQIEGGEGGREKERGRDKKELFQVDTVVGPSMPLFVSLPSSLCSPLP
jgi:hypothetical protein